MITHDEFKQALTIVNEYKSQLESHLKEVTKYVNSVGSLPNTNKETKIYKADVSVRLLNVLRSNDDKLGIIINRETTVHDLSKISTKTLLQCKGVGKKLLKELQELCLWAGITLQP